METIVVATFYSIASSLALATTPDADLIDDGAPLIVFVGANHAESSTCFFSMLSLCRNTMRQSCTQHLSCFGSE